MSRRGRAAGSCPGSAVRTRRSAAASSSCPSPTDRASRRTRRPRHPGRAGRRRPRGTGRRSRHTWQRVAPRRHRRTACGSPRVERPGSCPSHALPRRPRSGDGCRSRWPSALTAAGPGDGVRERCDGTSDVSRSARGAAHITERKRRTLGGTLSQRLRCASDDITPTSRRTWMTYVIAEPCIDVLDISCVSVCPVDCIHYEEGVHRKLYIDPNECIDCGACELECPVNAIFPEESLPPEWANYTVIDATWYTDKAAARAAVDELKPPG